LKVLEAESVGFVYEDGTVALDKVSLVMEEGEKVALVGPNGAGKSTLLHLIAGFRTPFSGKVVVSGKSLDSSSADLVRRDLGLVFQDPDDQVFMPTVEEDVAFGPRNLGLDDIDRRVTDALKSTGIEDLARRRPHRLSHGMKKRVAIAGVLAMDPKMLLLDEPTSGLDPRARKDLVRLLKEMDRTMLIATHDLEAASEIVDRVVVLNVGIVMQGTMAELVAARDVLESAGLEMPPLPRLFRLLEARGFPTNEMPVSMEQAVAELSKVIEGGDVRVRAHRGVQERKRAETGVPHPDLEIDRRKAQN